MFNQLFYSCIFVNLFLLSASSIAPFVKGEDKLLTEASKVVSPRQSSTIPKDKPQIKTMSSARSLKYMKKLYKRVSEKFINFPKSANTMRSVTPLEKENHNSLIDLNFDHQHSLVYNLTSHRQELVMASYLHLMGHRKPSRSTRLLFYLHSGQNGRPLETDKKQPVMVSLVNKLPIDIDVTKLIRQNKDLKSPLTLLRLQEEQLRRGQWVTSSSKSLSKKFPLLILVSQDSQLFDLEAFGGKHLKIGLNDRPQPVEDDLRRSDGVLKSVSSDEDNLRSKRSPKNYIKPDFESSDKRSIEPSQDSIPGHKDDNHWIQKQAFLESIVNPLSSSHDHNHSIKDNNRLEYFGHDDSVVYDSVIHEFRPYKTPSPKDYEKNEDNSQISIKKNKNNDQNKQRKRNKKRKNENKIKIFEPRKNERGKKDDDLLLPLEEYRRWPKGGTKKSRNKKAKKNNKKLNNFTPWDQWDYQNSPKSKRKNMMKKKKKKMPKRNHKISSLWLNTTLKHHDKDGALENVSSGKSCRKEDSYLNFKQLRWNNFIVAPHGYEFSFCAGQCPTSTTDAGTNHAIMQSLLRATEPSLELPGLCCVPDGLQALSILYYDAKGDLTLKTFPDMVVTSCSCQ